jgi:hypothetical protein
MPKKIYRVKFEDCTEQEPVKGWYIDDQPGLPIGPYRTRGEAKAHLDSRENWADFYAKGRRASEDAESVT